VICLNKLPVLDQWCIDKKNHQIIIVGLLMMGTFFLFLLFTSINRPEAAIAAEEPDCISWQKSGAIFQLRCDFASGSDVIIVLDRDQDNQPDMDTDAWFFDADSDQVVEMIIDFQKENESQYARLYDDRDGDGNVDYSIQDFELQINESDHWTVQVETTGSWWLADGTINYNLKILTDGLQNTIYGTNTIPIMQTNDGQIDWSYQVFDSQSDGIPDYWIYQLLDPLPPNLSLTRFSAFVNYGEGQVMGSIQAQLWPYLWNLPPGNTQANNMFSDHSLFKVDWQNAHITRAFFAGFPIENGFWINSVAPADASGTVESNFEDPHAWYDLAGDKDGYPELNVRLVHWRVNDINWPYSAFSPANEVRYSWNQSNAPQLAFEYKLGLFGNQSINEQVFIDPFTITTVDWLNLPQWVTGQSWLFASFIAVEGLNYQSSEGIYEWAPLTSPNGIAERYFMGESDNFPIENFPVLSPGMRGEYSRYINDQPWLYISPVDHKLHLQGADEGQWTISTNRTIQYQSHASAYIDLWKLFEADQLKKLLYIGEDHIVLFEQDFMRIFSASFYSPLFTVLPPANHREWLDLGIKLEAAAPDFEPDDFGAMAAKFGQPILSFTGIKLIEFDPEMGRNEAVVELLPGYRIAGDHPAELDLLTPGNYRLSYTPTDGLKLSPATSADLRIDTLSVDRKALSPGNRVRILADLVNSGSMPSSDVKVDFIVRKSDGSETLLKDMVLDIKGNQHQVLQTEWIPEQPGSWEVQLIITFNGTQITKAVPLEIEDTDRFLVDQVLNISGTKYTLPTAFGLLEVGAFLMVAVVVSVFIRNGRK
jgi:hypothetical protein